MEADRVAEGMRRQGRTGGGHAIRRTGRGPAVRAAFAGLALDAALADRDAEPWCGVLIVNLASGDIVEWIKLDGFITELFDVAVMPGVVCPMSIGPDAPEMRSTISFEREIAPLS